MEVGYEAINTAVTTLGFRPGAFKTVILITDEDRDVQVSALTFTSICKLLGAKDATLASIVTGGYTGNGGGGRGNRHGCEVGRHGLRM